VKLSFEGTRPGALTLARAFRTYDRLASRRHHRLVGGAGLDRLVRQVVQFLEIRVAQYEAILRVPDYECLGNRLDRIAQPQVSFHGALDQRLLLGDVDGDADEMRPAVARLLNQFAAGAQPHPIAVGMAHAEGMVDQGRGGVDELSGEAVEINILGMNKGIDLAEAQQRIARLEAQNRKHRMRPEHPSAGEIPVPQTATP